MDLGLPVVQQLPNLVRFGHACDQDRALRLSSQPTRISPATAEIMVAMRRSGGVIEQLSHSVATPPLSGRVRGAARPLATGLRRGSHGRCGRGLHQARQSGDLACPETPERSGAVAGRRQATRRRMKPIRVAMAASFSQMDERSSSLTYPMRRSALGALDGPPSRPSVKAGFDAFLSSPRAEVSRSASMRWATNHNYGRYGHASALTAALFGHPPL